MKISVLVEGRTESAFFPHLRGFLEKRLQGHMPRLMPIPYDGHIPTGEKLKRVVERLLDDGARSVDAVIALTDVYTGDNRFIDAADAKKKLNAWVGPNAKFFPHVAQYDFEAWLLPFWFDIQQLAGHNASSPAAAPESVNHNNPPSCRIRDIFLSGKRGKAYVKPRDAGRILRGKDLLVSARLCPELKSFLNTIITLSGGVAI